MQIVIDIDDNLYTRLFDNGVDNYDDAVDMAKAIRKGISLPKGHGRLVDEERISLSGIHFKTERDHAMMIGRLNSAPTIIEADKEQEDGSDN